MLKCTVLGSKYTVLYDSFITLRDHITKQYFEPYFDPPESPNYYLSLIDPHGVNTKKGLFSIEK